MDIANINLDNSIIICENNYKKKLLKRLTDQKLFLNIKFYSKKEFFKKYIFDYDEKTLFYLVNNYDLKVDIAKEKINALYYIDINKDYSFPKLIELRKLKQELIDNNLLIFDEGFKTFINNKKVFVLGYDFIEKYEENIFNDLNASVLKEETDYGLSSVIEFDTLEKEVIYVAKEICKLLISGVDINKIKIANVDKEYFNTIIRIFGLYNIPVKVDYDNNLFANWIAQIFLKSYNADITKSVESIKKYDSKIVNKIINICNKYSFVSDYNDVKNLIIEEIKNTKINNFNLKNYVDVVSYNEPFSEDEYVFLMNFNTGMIPKVIKDENYITDNVKLEIEAKSTKEYNKEVKKYTISKIKSIKNLIITYKLKSNKLEYYPSCLIEDLSLNTIKGNIDINQSYSIKLDQIEYAKKLDNYIKYNQIDEDFYIYGASYPNILYQTYDNKYKKIDKNLLKEYLNNKLVLSYSSLNNYNKCPFRYYLTNILKVDKYEETFETFIGSLFHDVLEKCFINELNVEEEINNYVKKNKKEITLKERFFINKITKDIKFVIEVLKKQREYTHLDKAMYESEIRIDKSFKDMQVEFIGFIDKILYKENDKNTLVSIIDYKTGSIDIELKYTLYGLSLQLPIYLYLVKKANLFNKPKFLGFYLQYILDKDIVKDNNKKYLEQKEDNLKLMGYSLNDPLLLEKFDETYENSKLVRGLKTKSNGDFSGYSKVLSEKQIDNLISLTEDNIDDAIDNICAANFDILPKKIGYTNDVGCKYCKFKDICFKKESDNLILDDVKDLSFLGGDDNA